MEENTKSAANEKLFTEFSIPTYDEWKEEVIRLLKGKPFEKAMFTKTAEGITINPIYRKEDLEKLTHIDTLPGYPPYVRGTKVESHVTGPWQMAQIIYEGTPESFNESLVQDLYKGQTSLAIAFDENTLKGIDADDAAAQDIGFRGLSASSLKDLEAALNDVVIDVLPLHIDTGRDPMPLTALFGAYAEKNNVDLKKLSGLLGYDPIGYAASHGDLGVSLDKAYDKMAQVITWCKENNCPLRTILVQGHPYHNGGIDSVQELAFVLSTAAEYIQAMLDRGFTIGEISKRIVLSISVGSNYFMEIAKIRALKMLYSTLIEAFGGDAEAQKVFIHAKTSSWTKTVYDPYVNMLRNASEAFSAAVGNVDSMTVVPFDEPIREADSFSRRVSRNIQYFLTDECHLLQPIDPAGGSWYVESLTAEIAEKTWQNFKSLMDEGGMSKLLENGEIAKRVIAKYDERFVDMAKRKHVWVGVNNYANMTEVKLEAKDVDRDAVVAARIKAVKDYKASAKKDDLAEKLEQYSYTPSVANAIAAVQSGATVGELDKAIEKGTDAYKATAIEMRRGAEKFEQLRDKTEAMAEAGKRPKVFSINLGPIPQHKPRADFSRGFFEVGAFEMIKNDGFKTNEEAIAAALESNAHVGIICSTDATYPESVPVIAKAIKEKNPNMIVMLAGRPPKDLEPTYREAGVDHFIYMGANCYDLLTMVQKEVENA